MAEQIKFLQLTQKQYDDLFKDKKLTVTKDGKQITVDFSQSAVYFVSDTNKIYKGSKQFSNFTANEIKLGAYASSTTAGILATDSISQALQRLDHTLSTVTGGDEGIAALSGRVTKLQDVTDGIGGTDEPATVIAAIEQSIGALDVDAVGGDNKVITTISEIDGKVSATAIDLIASNVGRSSTSAISSTDVQAALVELKGAIDASTAAQKTYTINALGAEAVANLGTNVRQAYQLVDEAGEDVGAPIKIYKDSSLIKVYLGANGTTTENATTEPVATEDAQGKFLNFVYQLATGEYQVVGVNVEKFLTESQFGDGLSVSGSGVVSVNIDNNTNQYVKIENGAIVDAGINQAISTAMSSANAYTDGVSSTLSAFVGSSIDTAMSSASAYADGLIEALDMTEVVGGTGKVVTTVSQTNGKVSATAVDLTASNVGRSSTSAISSENVQGALQELAGKINDAMQHTDGVSSTLSAFVGSSVDTAMGSASAYASGLVNSLDLPAVGGTGKVVTTVSQEDGQVSATAIDLIAANVPVSSVSGFSGSTVQATLQQFADLLMWNVLD